MQTGRDPRELIGAHLCGTILAAIDLVHESCANEPATAQMVNLFQETGILRMPTLLNSNLKRPTPDKVFRKVERNGQFVLIPASNAIGIVLRHRLTEEPTFDELEKLLKD
jgi:hypothetical protein